MLNLLCTSSIRTLKTDNMKNFKYTLIFLLLTLSCNYLDIVPDSIATIEDNAFSMKEPAERFMATCYSYMPKEGNAATPNLLGGDEIWLPPDFSASNFKNLAMGNQRVNSPFLDYWRGANSGVNLYRGISDCNIFLENIHRVPDISETERNRWIAEVEFLKAYYHFYLLRMYGPIPIKDVNVKIGANTEDLKVYRNTMDECFEYVVDKLDAIIDKKHLPSFIEDPITETGRITQGITLALKAKVLLYAASPLYNGNTDYIGFKDNRGIEIFNPVKSEEEKKERWQKAAIACREAIDFLAGCGQDRLYTFDEYMNISDITRQKLSLRGSMSQNCNMEVIWVNSSSWASLMQAQSLPRDLDQGKTSYTVNRNNFAVPLKITYEFYSKNGVPITEDKTWNYNDRFAIKTINADHQYLLAIGEQTVGLNFDRELRYYAYLGFDRGIWFGQGAGISSETSQFPKARRGEIASNQITHSWNVTGIWAKKYVNYLTSVNSSGISYSHYLFPQMRLPELYLMYAEALNEANNTQAARNEAIEWINLVRKRAGLPGVAESWSNFSIDPGKYTRQDGLRSIIQQETTIELTFEGHRFWNLRRWKRAMEEYNKPITGWNTIYSSATEYYTENLLFAQKFTPRDYFWPIHDEEVLRNANTLQNYGW